MALIGYDIDGVLTLPEYRKKLHPKDVVISGRLFVEYDDLCKELAQICPVYIRGTGPVTQVGRFKITIMEHLRVTTFYESDAAIAKVIRKALPNVTVIVPPTKSKKSSAWSL
jgi:hypothetical protein